jgi:peptidoglycan/xylan/chitin deacetylase (PgdA/CDA1 family)
LIEILNRFQSYFSSHILLYHSAFSTIPDDLKQNLHNVTPDTMYKQIEWVKKYFDIVEVDHIFDEKLGMAGKAAITFDDAYQSVFTEALPVIESLNVPCTIFINGITLSGKPFWRDKIRFLINNSLVNDFLKSHPSFCYSNNITSQNFYKITKSPIVNSKIIDSLLDEYLEKNQVSIDNIVFCVSDIKSIKKHPLISYGNHTYNHYVMSSINGHQQETEIKRNHELLTKCDVKLSKIFSVPFGDDKDFDSTTIDLLNKYQYIGFLYSRDAINIRRLNKTYKVADSTLVSRDRYMVGSEFVSFQKQIFKLGLKGLKKSMCGLKITI